MTKIKKKFFEIIFLKTQSLICTYVQHLIKGASNVQKARCSFALPQNLVSLLMCDI